MVNDDNIQHAYCSEARCFLLTSRYSVMVSFVPLPRGREIQGFVPSPMTKMFDTLYIIHRKPNFEKTGPSVRTGWQMCGQEHP